ncbi:hypothetical protein BLNAU_12387 [Blattamonas nauphoetae]|uniref:Uncharacterized protein n=1 Tax=Blattamonas nauphoetae TaxID=2049346 RepID=A0ABQ9XJY3_9EUKA|nr:hypothetical protein BLNAU_12387 [Blattamonas nauphoetae]
MQRTRLSSVRFIQSRQNDCRLRDRRDQKQRMARECEQHIEKMGIVEETHSSFSPVHHFHHMSETSSFRCTRMTTMHQMLIDISLRTISFVLPKNNPLLHRPTSLTRRVELRRSSNHNPKPAKTCSHWLDELISSTVHKEVGHTRPAVLDEPVVEQRRRCECVADENHVLSGTRVRVSKPTEMPDDQFPHFRLPSSRLPLSYQNWEHHKVMQQNGRERSMKVGFDGCESSCLMRESHSAAARPSQLGVLFGGSAISDLSATGVTRSASESADRRKKLRGMRDFAKSGVVLPVGPPIHESAPNPVDRASVSQTLRKASCVEQSSEEHTLARSGRVEHRSFGLSLCPSVPLPSLLCTLTEPMVSARNQPRQPTLQRPADGIQVFPLSAEEGVWDAIAEPSIESIAKIR